MSKPESLYQRVYLKDNSEKLFIGKMFEKFSENIPVTSNMVIDLLHKICWLQKNSMHIGRITTDIILNGDNLVIFGNERVYVPGYCLELM